MNKNTNTKNTNENLENKKIVWRLGKLPTIEELLSLVSSDIITKEEAREIMFIKEDIKSIEERKSIINENNNSTYNTTTRPGLVSHIKVFPF